MSSTYFVGFWNLENLFDVATAVRPPGLKKRLGKELVGWTSDVLDRKTSQIAAAIGAMNGGLGPDILGVCEIENEAILKKIISKLGKSKWKYIHSNSQDARGIDTAFLYKPDKFTANKSDVFTHFVMRRTYTRDILQASFKTKTNKDLVILVNHWPSRSGGRFESEPFRMTAAETLAHWHARVLEEHGRDANVLALGDFNDEPHDRSLMEYALATNIRSQVTLGSEKPWLLNLMWSASSRGEGTYWFRGQPCLLDQILVSRPILTGKNGLRTTGEAVIIRPPGVSDKPKAFGRPSKRGGVDPEGFSDHFAVGIALREV